MLDLATTLGSRYRIEARLGGGGMADVFEAYDEALGRPVAVKLLRGIDDPAAARRFAEEIRLTARLNHPNVVRLFDAGEHDGSPYLVLERVAGGTLAQLMDTGAVEPAHAAALGAQLASALAYAHEQGVVHRDVKPSNVLLTADQTVRLADFGIALTATATRLTVAGSVAGSAGYVSPEQVLGTGAGPASDVYALGLVLLECLTGEPPWTGTTVEVALARLASDPPIPVELGPDWHRLLTGMTARAPEDRPPMVAVAFGLQQMAAGQQLPGDVAPLIVRPPRRRVPVLAAVGGLLLIGAAAAALVSPPRTAVADSPQTSNLIAESVVHGAAVPAVPTAGADAAGEDSAKNRKASRKGKRDRAQDGDRSQGTAKADADRDEELAAPRDVSETVDSVTTDLPAALPVPAPPRAPREDAAPQSRADDAKQPTAGGDKDTGSTTDGGSTDTDGDKDKDKDKDKDRLDLPQRGRSAADVPGVGRGLQ